MALTKRKKIIIAVVALVALALIIVGSVLATRKDTPEVTIVKLETKRELRSNVTASGEVRPIQFINLTSEVQGRIEEILVTEGMQVTKGQVLVRLDPTQLQSTTDAQMAAFQAAQSDAQVARTQIVGAQNQLSSAQQSYNAALAAVDTAQQQVISAQADVDTAEKDLSVQRRELQRAAELLEGAVISRLEYDQAKDRVDQAEITLRNRQARLKSQQLAVNEARARAKQQEVSIRDARRSVETASMSARTSDSRVNQASAVLRGQKSQRDKSLVVAPINGVVADIPSKVGTFAVAGLSTTALMTIADMSSINIEVKVDETEIDKVAVGQKAKIKVDAFTDKELSGEVLQKTPLALGKSQTTGGLSQNINVQEAKEFRVVIRLVDLPKEISDGLRPGMSATATINTKTVENVIAVPLQALVEKKPEPEASPTVQGQAPPSEKPKPLKGVYIFENRKVRFVEVTTGITGESEIQITSGLSEGTEVVTGPTRVLKTLKDGDVVKQQAKKDASNSSS
jgi:HlyD family secretion protein